MKILALVLTTIFLAQPVLANNIVENTAIAALKAAKDSPTGTTVEHGGMIIQRDGGDSGPVVMYIEPNSDGKFDGVQVVDRKILLPGDVILATYHVHLCIKDYYYDRFSAQDVVAAIFSGVPEFMLNECTGNVHELTVGGKQFPDIVAEIRETGKVSHVFGPHCEKVDKLLPAGKIVGNIGETEVEKIIKGDDVSTTNPCIEVKKTPPVETQAGIARKAPC